MTIGYDIENLSNPDLKYQYRGEVTRVDRYGRKVPKHAHGKTAILRKKTSSTRLITYAVMMDLYDRMS